MHGRSSVGLQEGATDMGQVKRMSNIGRIPTKLTSTLRLAERNVIIVEMKDLKAEVVL